MFAQLYAGTKIIPISKEFNFSASSETSVSKIADLSIKLTSELLFYEKKMDK